MFAIEKPEDYSFEKFGITKKIFPSSRLKTKMSFVLVETEAGHEIVICQRECDFCYYVLEGSGYFEINGEREDCAAGDLAVIPAGNKFTYKGKMKLLLNCTPPWREDQEKTIK